MRSIVVHYKELALKGKNRSWFIRMLVRNLQFALAGHHVQAIRQVMGRIEPARSLKGGCGVGQPS